MIGVIGVEHKADICERCGLWAVGCGSWQEAGLANAHPEGEQTNVRAEAAMGAVRADSMQFTTHNGAHADLR
jgi:hypothetical protein